jgi:tetrahydromethanopterin S-methyltransferase subunit H
MGWVMTRSVPAPATLWILETTNDPHNGDLRSAADMVSEVRFLVANAHGVPIGVGEHNINSWKPKAREQANAMAAVDGVYWMNY